MFSIWSSHGVVSWLNTVEYVVLLNEWKERQHYRLFYSTRALRGFIHKVYVISAVATSRPRTNAPNARLVVVIKSRIKKTCVFIFACQWDPAQHSRNGRQQQQPNQSAGRNLLPSLLRSPSSSSSLNKSSTHHANFSLLLTPAQNKTKNSYQTRVHRAGHVQQRNTKAWQPTWISNMGLI